MISTTDCDIPKIFDKPVTLAFDPALTNDRQIKKIFHDRITRTLWLCFKSTHITSQYFNRDVIIMGNAFNKEFHRLEKILPGHGQTMDVKKIFINTMFYCQGPLFGYPGAWSASQKFMMQIRDYILGKKTVEFIIGE